MNRNKLMFALSDTIMRWGIGDEDFSQFYEIILQARSEEDLVLGLRQSLAPVFAQEAAIESLFENGEAAEEFSVACVLFITALLSLHISDADGRAGQNEDPSEALPE